ncbi:MAG: MerR family transcriptional regulator [Aggregatilineales bacterium]
MTQELAIGEVARRAGLQVSAIRYYESLGLLPIARRVHRQRRYDASILQRLTFIRVAQQVGFNLTQIRGLLEDFETHNSPDMLCKELARQKLVEIDKLIAQAQNIKSALERSLHCQCTMLEECTHTLNGNQIEIEAKHSSAQ